MLLHELLQPLPARIVDFGRTTAAVRPRLDTSGFPRELDVPFHRRWTDFEGVRQLLGCHTPTLPAGDDSLSNLNRQRARHASVRSRLEAQRKRIPL
jgi:hypothetical protein